MARLYIYISKLAVMSWLQSKTIRTYRITKNVCFQSAQVYHADFDKDTLKVSC